MGEEETRAWRFFPLCVVNSSSLDISRFSRRARVEMVSLEASPQM